jgi:hypothetical protein
MKDSNGFSLQIYWGDTYMPPGAMGWILKNPGGNAYGAPNSPTDSTPENAPWVVGVTGKTPVPTFTPVYEDSSGDSSGGSTGDNTSSGGDNNGSDNNDEPDASMVLYSTSADTPFSGIFREAGTYNGHPYYANENGTTYITASSDGIYRMYVGFPGTMAHYVAPSTGSPIGKYKIGINGIVGKEPNVTIYQG